MAIATSERLRTYLDAFTTFNERISEQPAWLRDLRERAFVRFCETGLPTTRDEDWRFTNVNAIAQTSFELADDIELSPNALKPFRIPGAACQLVFVNGRFAPALSHLENLPKHVNVGSLAEAIGNNDAALQKHLGKYLNIQRDAFCALNTAFVEDGGYIYLPRRTTLH